MNFKFLLPGNQNAMQKVGLFVSIVLLIAVLFIHNPFSGYAYCGGSDYANTPQEHLADLSACRTETFWGYVDPWYTLGTTKPFIYWFTTVGHVLLAISIVVSIGIAWIYIFKSNAKE